MRRLFIVLGLLAAIPSASATEFEVPTLRGSEATMPILPTATVWRGVYGGAGFSYSTSGSTFGQGVNDLAAALVRNTVLQPVVSNLSTLPKGGSNGTAGGAFFGYNTQWEGSILGFEFNYNRTSLNNVSADSIPPLLISNDTGAPAGHHFIYNVTLSGSESIHLTDLATFRARAGWIAGQFLPYAFIGAAVARADVTRAATLTWSRTDLPDPGNVQLPVAFGGGTKIDSRAGAFYYGYAAGLGLDVFVMPNIFVRGEWEYVQLPDVQTMRVNINSVRTAIGVKF